MRYLTLFLVILLSACDAKIDMDKHHRTTELHMKIQQQIFDKCMKQASELAAITTEEDNYVESCRYYSYHTALRLAEAQIYKNEER